MSPSERGFHIISVKMTDPNGAYCVYEVFNVTILNTSPYFLSTPTFKDLEVQMNSHVTQAISPTDIKDDENDKILLSIEYEDYPGHYI
jgi:hypothetical protein